MKKAALVLSVLVLFLVIGTNYAHAEPADTDESAVMQDPAMPPDPGMTADEPQCKMGMHGEEMMKEHHMPEGMGMMPYGRMERGGDRMMGHMDLMIEDPMEARHAAMRVMMMLNLDGKQKASGHELLDKTVKQMIKMKSDLLIAKLDLEEIVHSDPVDIAAAESKFKQIEAIKTDMFMTHLKAFEEFKAMLSPEQKSRLRELMETPRMGMTEGCKCMKMGGKEKAHHEKQEMNK